MEYLMDLAVLVGLQIFNFILRVNSEDRIKTHYENELKEIRERNATLSGQNRQLEGKLEQQNEKAKQAQHRIYSLELELQRAAERAKAAASEAAKEVAKARRPAIEVNQDAISDFV